MTGSGEVDPLLLHLLVSPVTKGPLEYDREAGELVSRSAGWPIRSGRHPDHAGEEARELDGDGR